MKCINIYRKVVLLSVAVFATLMTSCTDFLTIIPPDKVVHEQFWQTKDDVNGILATSYLKLSHTDAISRAIIWGELRSDNLTFRSGKDKDAIKYIVEANINDENAYTKWGKFYEAINDANLVIEYAHLVTQRDPDFTQGDLDVVVGEMYAMRALCHFYLVRSFRDIPMAMTPAANDSELPDYEQVHPLEALEMIMNDLDIAEKLVMPSGNYSDPRHNYGRFTKNAVLAMKADVNLWRAAFTTYYSKNGDKNALSSVNVQNYYSDCINNCQAVLDNIDKLYIKNNQNGNKKDDELPYHLISNQDQRAIDDETYTSIAFDRIFCKENSSESIFEIQIDKDLVKSHSSAIPFMYGHKDQLTGEVEVPEKFLEKYEKDDLRKYSYTNTPHPVDGKTPDLVDEKLAVRKYIAQASPASKTVREQKDIDANWIVYRQTDVMLMMAEALVEQPSASQSDIEESFKLVNIINKRARVDSTYIINPLSQPRDIESAIQLVLDERSRELAFEGKRWYDLVRKALRENTVDNIKFVADKLTSNVSALKNKMQSIDNLFMPIHIDELRFNKKLVQNPAYGSEESSIGIKK